MREFSFILRDSFTKGLRSDSRLNRNKESLDEVINLQVTPYGLESFKEFTDPFNGSETVLFPFPQLFIGEGETILAGETVLESVDMSVTPWVSNPLTTYDGRNSELVKSIPAGDIWHFADMKDTWFLFNQNSIVFKTNHRGLKDLQNKILVLEDITINTGLYHRGRMLLGGFNPNDFWNSDWENLFLAWKESLAQQIPFGFSDIGSNWVIWSSIGGGDFPLWLFYPNIAVEGFMEEWGDNYTFDIENSMLLEHLRRGEFGFMPMPWQGTVQRMLPMGNNVIVYGDEGISALVPASAQGTFGLKRINDVGVVSRGAVFGTEDSGHVYLDKSGDLWLVTQDLQAERLGFSEFLFDLVGNKVIVTYDEHRNNFYITDSTNSFVLDQGLTKIREHPTSTFYHEGGKIGLFTTEVYSGGRVVTGAFDMGFRGIKTITAIAIGADSTSRMNVAIDYKYNKGGVFKRSGFFLVNDNGFAEFRVSGVEFRLIIETDSYIGFNLDYAEVRYQAEDKRYIRGTRATETVS